MRETCLSSFIAAERSNGHKWQKLKRIKGVGVKPDTQTELTLLNDPPPSLPRLTDAKITALYTRLRKSRKEKIRGLYKFLGLSLFFALIGVLIWRISSEHTRTTFGFFVASCLCLTLCFLFGQMDHPATQRNKKLVRELREEIRGKEDARCLGILFEVSRQCSDSGIHPLGSMDATPQIQQLLLQLTPADVPFLDAKYRVSIRDSLGSEKPESVFAALHAVTVLGDKQALPLVEKLANRTSKGVTEAEIRQIALAGLPSLKARIEEIERGEGLLRPCISDEAPKTLLRPAPLDDDQNPERQNELLRPGDTPPE